MLWYKAWLDTRWRFLIGLALLLVSACSTVVTYLQVRDTLAAIDPQALARGSALAEAIVADLGNIRTFADYVWFNWFDQNLTTLGTIFAALLGSGSALSASGRGLLFSLALPVSRKQWVGARAAVGLSQLLALGVLPSLAIPLLAPLVGQSFGAADALLHGLCVAVGAGVFFGIASLLSTLFNDVWRPLLLTCLVALVIGTAELALPNRYGLFDVMSAAEYFRGGSLPWIGLLVSAAVTAGLLYAAAANIERRDF
jgi:hypothetical protein